MMQRLYVSLLALWRFMQSPRLLFFVLLYFMGLLVIGTLAQKYIGLFAATHLFFNSFFYWIDSASVPLSVPVPAGASVLLVLCLNLAAHFVTSSKWSIPYIGSTLAHLSILILLLGGGITLWSKQEGFILLLQNEPVQRVYDYHQREIVLFENAQEIAVFSANNMIPDNALSVPRKLPFTIMLKTICKNCVLDDDNQLQEQDINLEDEVNQWGASFQITGQIRGNKKNDLIAVTEFQPPQPLMQWGNNTYYIALRRKSWDLPFSLRLEHFTPTYYTGTDIAQSYESSLHVLDDVYQTSWPAIISMNDPLRYKGYTLYQSSFLTLPDKQVASVLNVVKNTGWIFPYIATFLLFSGLLIHLGVRRHAPD